MLTKFIPEGAIRVPLVSPSEGAVSKETVIAELVDLLPQSIDAGERSAILSAVMHREGQMSTGIGDGIAIPHGSADIEPHLMVSAGVSPDPGVDYNAIDKQPARLFFLLVARKGERTTHLQALAHIARLLKTADTRQALLDAPDAEAFRRILASAE